MCFARPRDSDAYFELAFTVAAQGIVWWLYSQLPILAMVLDAMMALRWFAMFHDCAHATFVTNPLLNRMIGLACSVVLGVPHDRWALQCHRHHAHFGELRAHSKDPFETILVSKRRWKRMSLPRKAIARVVRSPLMFFSLTPALQIFVTHPLQSRDPWTLVGHVLRVYFGLTFGAWWHVWATYGGAVLILMLTHVQHATDLGYRAPPESWDRVNAAMLGSTWLRLPAPLAFFTLGGEYHHIHHVSVHVPCYRLQECHRAAPAAMWKHVSQTTLLGALGALTNVLWNEETGRFEPLVMWL